MPNSCSGSSNEAPPMHPASRILNWLSRVSCELMQAPFQSLEFSANRRVLGFPDRSTSTPESAQLPNRTTTGTIGRSWTSCRLWSNGVTTSRGRLILSSFNATLRTSGIFKHQKCSPVGGLDEQGSSLCTTSLSNPWIASRTQPPDHRKDPTRRSAMKIWRPDFWLP